MPQTETSISTNDGAYTRYNMARGAYMFRIGKKIKIGMKVSIMEVIAFVHTRVRTCMYTRAHIHARTHEGDRLLCPL